MCLPNSIDFVVQNLPPVHDAIGEYSSYLAAELVQKIKLRILTHNDFVPHPINGVTIATCISRNGPARFTLLKEMLCTTTADAVLLQYNPFAWGKRGWVPSLVSAMRNFKRARPGVRFGVMFHETFMMNPGWRSWVMRQYQRHQFLQLLSIADVNFFSTELWAKQHVRRNQTGKTIHLPVGANVPESVIDPAMTRVRLGMRSDDFVCGVFGGSHPSRMLNWIENAVEVIKAIQPNPRRVVFLHVGGERIEWAIQDVPIITTGRLNAVEASDAIATMDLMINPFSDGISARRGSAMAALQNGVPVLSTRGNATDGIWETVNGKVVFLASSTDRASWTHETKCAFRIALDSRDQVTAIAKPFYQENFSWPVIARIMRCGLGEL